MRAIRRRIGRVQNAIDAAPVREHVLQEAYAWFTMFGELPDDDHVAFEVVEKALRGGEDAPPEADDVVAKRADKARLAYHKRERPRDHWPPSVRGMLFDEALFDHPPLRELARRAIAVEVAYGGDVENPAFGARHGIPGYGNVAMHVLGWPAKLVAPPYEDEARRLLVRLDNLRGRIPHGDPNWTAVQGGAVAAFYRDGALPDDDLHLEVVLVNVGLDLLQAHRGGKDVAKGIALIGKLERAEGEEFLELLQVLSELAAARLL